MSQTNLKSPLHEAMLNINKSDTPDYSAFREAVKSIQTMDTSVFKLVQEAIKPKELSTFQKAIKSIQQIDLSEFKLAQETIRPKELSAFQEAIKSIQQIDLSALKLAQDTIRPREFFAFQEVIKNLENVNPSNLSGTSVTSRPVQQHRKISSNIQRDPNNLVISAKQVGLKIKNARKGMGMNQKTFADLSGVGRRFISELERGKPTLEFDRVLKVCTAAGIDFFAISRRSNNAT